MLVDQQTGGGWILEVDLACILRSDDGASQHIEKILGWYIVVLGKGLG